MAATKIRSKWVSGLLEFFGVTAGTTVLKITESGIEANLTGNVTGDIIGNVTGNVTGAAYKAEARTATADGTGTGQISSGTTMVTVTSDDANKIITLPAPAPGLKITIINGATGYELRTSAPATIGINGGTGENAESAIAANIIVIAECVSATAWICSSLTAAGVKGVVEVAA